MSAPFELTPFDPIEDPPHGRDQKDEKYDYADTAPEYEDPVFGNEDNAEIKYRTMAWW